MDKKYKAAIIGCGTRGKSYAKVLDESNRFEIYSVCDLKEDVRMHMYNRYDCKHQTEDYNEAILHKEVDVVFVCTPAYFHSEITILALENNKHVICEKPMSISLKEANKMVKVQKETGGVLGFGFQCRNMGNYRKMKKAMDGNYIGSPVMMRFNDIRSIRPKPAMHDAEFGNGGPLVDMSCHFYDLMRWFFKAEPVSVTARGFTFCKPREELGHIKTKAPDTAAIIVEFESEDIGVVNLTWGLPPTVKGKAYCDAFGDKGYIEPFSAGAKGSVLCRLEDDFTKEFQLEGQDVGDVKSPEMTVINNFADTIEGKSEIRSSALSAYQTLAISMASIKSMMLKRPVTIEEIKKEQPDVKSLVE